MAANVEIPISLYVDDIEISDISLRDLDAKLDHRLGSLRKTIASIFEVDPSEFTKAMNTASTKVLGSFQKLTVAAKQFEAAQMKAGQSSGEYQKILAQFSEIERAYKAQAQSVEDAKAKAHIDPGFFNQQVRRLKELEQEYNRLKALASDPIRFADKGAPEYIEKAQAALQKIIFTMRDAEMAEQGWTNAQVEAGRSVEGLGEDVEETTPQVSRLASMFRGIGTTFRVVSSTFGAAKTGINKVIQKFKQLANTIKGVVSGIKSAINHIKQLGKHGSRTGSSLAQTFKKLKKDVLMYGLGFRTAYFAIRRLRRTFMDAFKTMAAQFPEINAQLNVFTMSFNRLKGALGTVFQPLASVAIPVLVRFMEYLAQALELVAEFFAVLTGQRVIYTATSNQEDYAGSLNDTANATNKVRKANEKLLASYDKLDVIKHDNDTDNDNAGSVPDLPLNVTYEMVSVSDAISEFAEKIKEAWANEDFTEIGQILTNKVLDILDNIEETVVPKVTGFINKIANIIVTFVDGADFEAIGLKIGNIINKLLAQLDAERIGQALASIYNMFWRFAYGLVNNIDWDNVGKTIAEFVTGFVDKLDTDAIIGTLTGLINGIADAVISFVDNVDWAELTKKFIDGLKKFIEGINVEKLRTALEKIGTAIGEIILTALGEFDITKPIADSWEENGESTLTSIETSLTKIKNTVRIVFNTIKKVWEKTGKKVFDKMLGLVTAISDGIGTIAEQFGKAWEDGEKGESILTHIGDIIGLIADTITTIVEWITKLTSSSEFSILLTVVDQVLISVKESLEAIQPILPVIAAVLKAIMIVVELITAAITLLHTTIARLVAAVVKWIVELWVKIGMFFANFQEQWENIKEFLANTWEAVKNALETAWNNIKDFFANLWSNIKLGLEMEWNDIVNFFSMIWLNIKADLEDAWNGIKNFFTLMWKSLKSDIEDTWNSIKKFFSNAWFSIKTDLEDTWNGIKTFFSNAWLSIKSDVEDTWNGIKNFFVNVWNSIRADVEDAWNGIKNFVTLIWNSLKADVEDTWTGIKNFFSDTLDAISTKFTDVWTGIRNFIRGIINGMIGFFEKLVNGVIDAVNFIIRALNKLSIKIPDWVPGLGGETWGFNISQIQHVVIPKLPELARGAVIPPNKEFLAMLGDQKSGTNIEAPLDTIKQALAEVLTDDATNVSHDPIVLVVDGKTLAKIVWDENKKKYKQTGKYSPVYT